LRTAAWFPEILWPDHLQTEGPLLHATPRPSASAQGGEAGRLYALGGDDAIDTPEYKKADGEASGLEYKIVLHQVKTPGGQTAKLQFMKQYDIVNIGLDGETLIEMILELDTERIAAARRVKTGRPAERLAARWFPAQTAIKTAPPVRPAGFSFCSRHRERLIGSPTRWSVLHLARSIERQNASFEPTSADSPKPKEN
jgi:hypothetical protein